MGQPIIQTSFNSGEWAPALYGRVDLQKYHSGAALLRNFFVDYRGGATTRPGSHYILQARSNANVRLIPFQASLGVTYVLEFGQGYIRFYNNGSPVVENAKTITSAASGPPEVFTLTAHGYANNDWLFIGGSYFIVHNVTINTFTLTDLFANAITTNPFTLPISAQRLYTLLNSPYQSVDLAQLQLKYAQNVNQLYLCHPNYPPYVLTLNTTQTQPNWTLSQIVFGATLQTPGISGIQVNLVTSGTSAWLAYVVTAVDVNGIESAPSAPVGINNNFFGVNYTISISIAGVPNAKSYNIYKSIISIAGSLPAGTQFGFAGNVTATSFVDTTIVPNFGVGPPVVQSPFSGAGVASITLTNQGSGYNNVPSVQFSGGAPSSPAVAVATLITIATGLFQPGSFYHVGDVLSGPFSFQIQVTAVTGLGAISSYIVVNQGSDNNTGQGVPSVVSMTGGFGAGANISLTWGVGAVTLIYAGAGYLATPTISFAGGGGGIGASAVAALGASSGGNPQVPALVQQRLFLGGLVQAPSQFNLSQPGSPFNFNTTFPVEADNAIQGTLSGQTLNTIKSAVAVSAGLVILTDKGAWLLNGGTAGSAISALSLVANPQAYSGASDVTPIVTPNDILYVQAKGSVVRDLAYNFYLNNYVGTDITILSSHLFYTYTVHDWCWAEEPFKLVWLVRSDGALLSLSFIKEQELIAWSQHVTLGSYQSICTVPESTATAGLIDAVYTVVQRNINGQTVNYIERFAELAYPNDYKSSWQVDAGIGYNGAAATTFSGAQHLGGQVVTGVADGVVINFTMPSTGTFVFGPGGTAGLTLIPNASIVTVGLGFTPTLTTLPLDLGEPDVLGKRKKINAVTLKLAQTLGLSIGSTIANATPMTDIILGNNNEPGNFTVTGLVTGMARTYIDPDWNVPGQYTITQPNPYPASILAVIPETNIGDTEK